MGGITKVQCNSNHVAVVTGFFKGRGHTVTEKNTGEMAASGSGTLVHVTVKPPFDPFKLDSEGLRKWQDLKVHVLEHQK